MRDRHVRRSRAQLRLPRRERALARPLVTEPSASAPEARVAIVGCGVISRAYAHTMRKLGFIELAACVDDAPGRAEELATEFGARASTLGAVLQDPGIDAVVNLTPPLAHAAVSSVVLEAGKAGFSEKAPRGEVPG